MDNKFIGLFLVFSLFILIIPNVSALEIDNDTNITDLSVDVVSINTIDSPTDEEILAGDSSVVYFDASVENDGNGSFDNPYKYLRSTRLNKITAAYFADGIYKLDNYKGIYADLEIFGQSAENTIIKYDGMAFSVGIDTAFSATNITFLKASIRNFGVFVAEDCIFKDCIAAYVDDYGNSFGGAVYCKSGGFTNVYSPGAFITNCAFIDNYAVYGGACYIELGILSITDSKFINNSAQGYGGAVGCEGGSTLTVTNSYFESDKSIDDAGGAIYSKVSSVNIKDSDFVNCQAFFGGAICNLNGQVITSSSKFKNNSAKYDGGAVYGMYGRFTLSRSELELNNALNGGALFLDNCSSASFNNNVFTSNRAVSGGAIFLNANNKLTNISNTFSNNTAVIDDDLHVQDNYPVVIEGKGNHIVAGNYSDWEGEIPDYYNLYDDGFVTPVRDQQMGGNCWGFSAIAALESCILKVSNMSFDFSEENIKNLIEWYSAYGWMRDTNEGGYDEMSFAYLASWLGPIYDELDVYDDYSTLSPVLDSAYHVQDIIFAPIRHNYTDNDGIKKTILKYGAVSASYGHSSSYYNPVTYAYYYPNAGYGNHAITVVGWNDNYSASNFLMTPLGDGAWIIKNSWNDTWGNDGFFYISYYDAILFDVGNPQSAYTFPLINSLNFTKNYQYDFAGLTDYLITGRPTMWYSNQFNSTGREYVAAFSTYFDDTTDFEAFVYVNDKLMLTQNGTSAAGYHTINLNELIHVNVGDTFKVALKITAPKYANVPISESVMSTRKYYVPGVSFISFNGKTWFDLYNYSFGYGTHHYSSQVACLKIFTINRENGNTTIIINNSNSVVGKPVSIIAEVREDNDNLLNYGNVEFIVSNERYVVDVINGIANLTLTFNSDDIYDVSAFYTALNYYNPSNATAVVNISKIIPVISFNIDNIIYGDALIVNISLNNDISDNVALTVGNKSFIVSVINGNAVYYVPEICDVSDYSASLVYGGSDKYYNSSAKLSFKISKKDISMNVTVLNSTESINITVTFSENISNNVGIIVGNESYVIPIKNSIATLRLDDLNGGIYPIIVEFESKNYETKSFATSVKIVNELKAILNTNDLIKYFSASDKFIINLTDSKSNPLVNETVIFSINGKNYTRHTNKNGLASMNINLNSGTYNITTIFTGNQELKSVQTSNIINVKSTIDGNDIVKYFRNATQYCAVVYDSNGNPLNRSQVTFNINGVFYTRTTNENGIVRLNINLNPGEYVITLLNNVTGEKSSNIVTVLSKLVENNDLVKYYRNASQYTIKVLDNLGNPLSGVNVTFNINGVFYNRTTNDDGVAKLNINLNPGQYIITAEYNGLRASNNITVLSTLVADDLVMNYEDGSQFSVKVLDNTGSPLTNVQVKFNINGVLYNRYTNSQGTAVLNIHLMRGVYIITTSYNKLNMANKITIN